MATILFFVSLNLVLISRLMLTFKDDGIETPALLKMSAIPFIVLLFMEFNTGWILLFVYLLVNPVATYFLEKNKTHIYRNRGLMLIAHILVFAIIFSSVGGGTVNSFTANFLGTIEFTNETALLRNQILLFGGLMVMNEMNIVLRYLMKVLRLDPLGKDDQTVSDQEYNTGRIIGMLERIFIFIFAIASQFTAVGFILTAKGVVRYQDFKNRTFAEYVLIGTLLSTLLAVGMALILKGII